MTDVTNYQAINNGKSNSVTDEQRKYSKYLKHLSFTLVAYPYVHTANCRHGALIEGLFPDHFSMTSIKYNIHESI